MKFKQFYLQEKFFRGMKVKLFPGDAGTYAEIYMNPSQGEIDDIFKDSEFGVVRIGIDKKNNVYAWKGEVIHYAATKALNIDLPFRFDYAKKNPTVIVTGEGMGKDWPKHIQWKAVKQLKRSFPKAKTIESLMGSEKIKI